MTAIKEPYRHLASMLEEFVERWKRSVALANKIEVFISEHFEDDESLEDLLVALASYRPEGGDFLLNEQQMVDRCRKAVDGLRRV